MDLQPNKTDAIIKPITNTRISASEWNQLVGSCMEFITQAGLTPDAADNEQLLNAFKIIAANLELIGANTNLSNLTTAGEAKFVGRTFTPLDVLVAEGPAGIAGEYTLSDLPDDGVTRLGLFACKLVTTQAGASEMDLKTDVMTSATLVATTNNQFGAGTTVILPIKNKVTISFPTTTGGIGNRCSVRFKGYL